MDLDFQNYEEIDLEIENYGANVLDSVIYKVVDLDG